MHCWQLGLVLLTQQGWIQAQVVTARDEPREVHYPCRARGIPATLLQSDVRVVVAKTLECWTWAPAKQQDPATALLFFPGGGVDPVAYAPLARAVVAYGYAPYLVKSTGPIFSLERQRRDGIKLGKTILQAKANVQHWLAGGHSMGATLAAKMVYEEPQRFKALILLGTTHPRDFDLSNFPGEVTKVYASNDRVARQAKSEANKHLLPATTNWICIERGNHAQFGSFGQQFGDGKPSITRDQQPQQTQDAIIDMLARVAKPYKDDEANSYRESSCSSKPQIYN